MDSEFLKIVTYRNPGRPWADWIAALSEEGFECEIVDHAEIDEMSATLEDRGIVLLDGMLPRLSRLIMCIADHCPDAQLIVATRDSSFTIYHEALQHGAIYISDLESPARFVRSFRKAAMLSDGSSDGLLPSWI